MKRFLKNIYFIFALLFIFSFGCEKKNTNPEPTPGRVYDRLFIMRVAGYSSFDSIRVVINNSKVYTQTYIYNEKMNTGDVVNFYFKGTPDPNASVFNFSIWENENKQPSESIKIFNPSGNIIQGSYIVP